MSTDPRPFWLDRGFWLGMQIALACCAAALFVAGEGEGLLRLVWAVLAVAWTADAVGKWRRIRREGRWASPLDVVRESQSMLVRRRWLMIAVPVVFLVALAAGLG